jgi:hypothetical protein
MKKPLLVLCALWASAAIAFPAARADTPQKDAQRLREAERRASVDRRPLHRVVAAHDADLDRYRERYALRRGWREYGVTYGLPADLAAHPELSFLDDVGLLVGSYDAWGHTVYVYVYDEGVTRHRAEVLDDGHILNDNIFFNFTGA